MDGKKDPMEDAIRLGTCRLELEVCFSFTCLVWTSGIFVLPKELLTGFGGI